MPYTKECDVCDMWIVDREECNLKRMSIASTTIVTDECLINQLCIHRSPEALEQYNKARDFIEHSKNMVDMVINVKWDDPRNKRLNKKRHRMKRKVFKQLGVPYGFKRFE